LILGGEKMKIEKTKKKKGQVEIGIIITIFVAIIVGLALFLTTAQTVGVATSTIAVANESLGATVVNGTAQYLTSYRSISDVVIYNETGDFLIGSGNYTVTNNVVYNGAEAVMITPDTGAITKSKWQVSGTAEPLGYVGGAGRSMALLIPVLFGLAIAILVLEPTIRGKILEIFD
jgi:hypothetical protein